MGYLLPKGPLAAPKPRGAALARDSGAGAALLAGFGRLHGLLECVEQLVGVHAVGLAQLA